MNIQNFWTTVALQLESTKRYYTYITCKHQLNLKNNLAAHALGTMQAPVNAGMIFPHPKWQAAYWPQMI